MIAINQPYFFPYIGYFLLIKCCDTFVSLDNVKMRKKSFITRNNFGGNELYSLSIQKLSQNRNIDEHTLKDVAQKNQFTNYFKVHNEHKPYYYEAKNIITEVFLNKSMNIGDINYNTISTIAKKLNTKTRMLRSRDLDINKDLRGVQRLIEICKGVGDDHYLNLPGGSKIYSKGEFEESGVRIEFIDLKVLFNELGEDLLYTSILTLIAEKGLSYCSDVLEYAANNHLRDYTSNIEM